MKKSVLKKLLLVGAVGGVVLLGYNVQKYARMFFALSKYGVDDRDRDKDDDDGSPSSPDLDDLLKDADAVRVRISSEEDNESGDGEDRN